MNNGAGYKQHKISERERERLRLRTRLRMRKYVSKFISPRRFSLCHFNDRAAKRPNVSSSSVSLLIDNLLNTTFQTTNIQFSTNNHLLIFTIKTVISFIEFLFWSNCSAIVCDCDNDWNDFLLTGAIQYGVPDIE